jgi:predicted permease
LENFILIGVCLLLGIVFQKVKDFPENTYLVLNNFIIYVSLPAVTLLHVPELKFSKSLWMPIATAWIVFVVAAIFFKLLQSKLNYNNATLGCLILTCGLLNSSFIGFPVIHALYGEVGLSIAIMVDQPGSFVVLSTLGVAVAAWLSTGKADYKVITQKIISFPPLWGFAIATIMLLMNWHHHAATLNMLKVLANTMTPLALISVGMQLKFSLQKDLLKELSLGLTYKLLLAPALLYVVFFVMLNSSSLEAKVSIMEAAMAPMITGALLASKYNLNPRLAGLMVGVGIPLSFFTLFFWYWLVG